MLTQLKDDPNIVIAKSDTTGNDYPPQFQVQGSVVVNVWVWGMVCFIEYKNSIWWMINMVDDQYGG